MVQKPSISIITPVWNGMPFIQECVESVIMQDFQDWEMLIGDNCSDDGTLEYLQGLTDPRIRLFAHENNLGIFGNLNFLFSQASSQVSQILCADDYLVNKTSLLKIVGYWQEASPSIGIAIFNQSLAPNCRLTALQKRILPEIINPTASDLLFYCFGNIAGNLSNVSVQTDVVAKNGGFREDLPYSGDFEFWSRAATGVAISIQKEFVINVRRHPGVASNYLNRKGELIRQNAVIINYIYNKLIQKFPNAHFALRLHGTLNYDALQRDAAVKLLLKGKREYMNRLNDVTRSAPFSMSFITCWWLFIISAGGRLGRATVAKYLYNKCSTYNI